MTIHTIHDGVIKAMHEYDKHSAKHSALETIHQSYNSRLSYI